MSEIKWSSFSQIEHLEIQLQIAGGELTRTKRQLDLAHKLAADRNKEAQILNDRLGELILEGWPEEGEPALSQEALTAIYLHELEVEVDDEREACAQLAESRQLRHDQRCNPECRCADGYHIAGAIRTRPRLWSQSDE